MLYAYNTGFHTIWSTIEADLIGASAVDDFRLGAWLLGSVMLDKYNLIGHGIRITLSH